MNESKPTAEASVQRRRRVLRGAISAPLVLTVTSGAATTMTSNRRCLANQVTSPPHGIRTYSAGATTVPATVLRLRLYLYDGKRYVSGTEIGLLAHPQRPVSWISSGQWQEFNVGTNLRVGSPGTLPVTTPPLTNPVQYVVVQLDQHGYIVSVGNNTTSDMSLVHGTCWNSFIAGSL